MFPEQIFGVASALEALEIRDDKDRVKEIVAEELVGRLLYLSGELKKPTSSLRDKQVGELIDIVNDFIHYGSVPTRRDLADKLARIALDINQDFVHEDEVLRLAKLVAEFDERNR